MQHPPHRWPRWMICHSNKGSNEKEATHYRVAFFVRIKQKSCPYEDSFYLICKLKRLLGALL